MTSIIYRATGKPGEAYAYQSESFRDPVTGEVKTSQNYLGVADTTSKEIIRPKGKRKRANDINNNINKDLNNNSNKIDNSSDSCLNIENISVGPFMLLDKVSNDLNILYLLKIVFPDIYLDILSLVYYIIQTGSALSNCHVWSRRYIHPSGKIYTSQDISSILDKINNTQCNKFLHLWLNKFLNSEYLCYDITSISSYNKNIPFIKRGYNRDHEKLPQINLAVLLGQQSGLPAYYRRIQGNITDVQTLDNTINSLDILGIKGIRFVLDRGFYSENNVTNLLNRPNTHFTLAVPNRRKWVEAVIDDVYRDFCIPNNHFLLDNNEYIYAKTNLYKWLNSKRRLYLHMYYNDHRAADDHNEFIVDLKKYKELIESNFNKKQYYNEYFNKYLFIKQTAKRGISITYNNEAILNHKNKYAGFFCILSTFFKDPIKTLEVYRNKDVVEKSFDDLKNELELNRFRVHTSPRMDAKIFIHFLALIITSKIRKIYKPNKDLYKFSSKNLVQYMETLEQSKIKGRFKTFYTEADKTHKKIFEIFNLSWPG
jgi:transposase